MPAALSSSLRWPATYWTGIWEPRREAISKEVAFFRAQLAPGSPVVSFTPQSSALLPGERVLRLHYRRWIPLRAAAAMLEPLGSVTHMFGGIDAAHFLLVLGRRPLLFTVTVAGAPQSLELYNRVSRFVVESRGLARILTAAGVPSERIDIIYPGVDLTKYADSSPPPAGFRIVFASTPSNPDEIEQRGINLLIDLARARPDIEIQVLWRNWGAVGESRRRIEELSPPGNFRIRVGDVPDMLAIYREAHATACCFAPGYGKSAPNSIVEAMAAGRPVLLTDTCGIADLVAENQAGVVAPRTVEGLAAGVEELRSHYEALRVNARRLAEREFDNARVLARYARIYQELNAM